jgi:tetratricopeptide (TPR) repeat protein
MNYWGARGAMKMFDRNMKPQSPLYTNGDQESDKNRWLKNLNRTLVFLAIWLAGGFGTLFLCGLAFYVQDPTRVGVTKGLSVFSNGALLSIAFAAIGGLVGFLFGIPRRLSAPQRPVAKDEKGGTTSDSSHDPSQTDANTNLEQVSDWLTKIILGAGLTQLVKVPGLLKSAGEYFKPGFEDKSFLPLIIIIGSVVFGFFAGYLITQLFLAKALVEAGKTLNEVSVAINAADNLERVGKFTAAAATLEGALSTLKPDTSKEAKRDIYERLTYNALYETPPDGFQKAIRFANDYINHNLGVPSARIYVNLAAALGQKYKWDSAHNGTPEALEGSRKGALDAAKKAIAIEPAMKNLLRMLWNPNDPTKIQSEEDDLEVFFNDPEFKALLQ